MHCRRSRSVVEGEPLVMSKATKKKHVAREVLEDLVIPNDKQQIVRVSCVITDKINKLL